MTRKDRYLDVARAAIAAATVPILRYYHGQFDVETKPDQTPVTVADREAEQRIRQVILEAFPDHAFYGEEFGREGGDSEYLWLVDPIDGTKSFIKGYGMFSTQIALMHGEDIILGISHAPAHRETAWAVRGEGAWVNDSRARISDCTRCSGASISTGNIGSLAASGRWSALGRILSLAGRTRGYGDYYHYHRLAAGQIDAVIESDVNILDIAALSLIVSEAGGLFTDLAGDPVGLETRSVLAANPALHARLLERLDGVTS
jgi:histidinol-phosphatase